MFWTLGVLWKFSVGHTDSVLDVIVHHGLRYIASILPISLFLFTADTGCIVLRRFVLDSQYHEGRSMTCSVEDTQRQNGPYGVEYVIDARHRFLNLTYVYNYFHQINRYSFPSLLHSDFRRVPNNFHLSPPPTQGSPSSTDISAR